MKRKLRIGVKHPAFDAIKVSGLLWTNGASIMWSIRQFDSYNWRMMIVSRVFSNRIISSHNNIYGRTFTSSRWIKI